jgi:CRP-like cAMP-binding protein
VLEDAFPFLSEEERGRLLGQGREETYSAGETVLAEGTAAFGLFVLLEGEAAVTKSHLGGSVPIGTIGEGGLFGEISYLDGSPASASVIARSPAKVLVLEDLDSVLAADPSLASGFYRSLAYVLAKRLRFGTEDRVLPALQWG